MRQRQDVSGHRASVDREHPDARTLDRALASGVTVDGRPEWLLRSRELCTRSERYELARSLVVVLEAAQHATVLPTRLNAPAIRRCHGRIRALVALLKTECRFDVRGLALAWLLFEEPRSPLFDAGTDRTLEQALDEITAAL